MPRSLIPALAVLAVSMSLVAPPVWGHGGDDAANPKANVEVAQGSFFPTGEAGEDIVGYAKVARHDGGTDIYVQVAGLAPLSTYPSHLHEGTCVSPGPHYRHDPEGPERPPNELWPSSDPDDPRAGLISDEDGQAGGAGHADWRAREEARSVMIHDGETGDKLACADLN